jgi:Pectate lyase superfamily protein/Carboxypeptidase regulatory-like domain
LSKSLIVSIVSFNFIQKISLFVDFKALQKPFKKTETIKSQGVKMVHLKFKTVVLFIFIWQILTISAFAQQTYFPTDVAWKNVKTDYGAVGDGITDDTLAFQRAFTTLLNQYNSRVSVYVPSGTYLVSDRIATLETYYDCCLTLQGENPATTIIKLKDNAAGFQDAANPRPVLYTRGGNQAFSMYFFNITINTGNGNAGAVGLDYISSNYGAVDNVKIISPDGSGYTGIEMERQWAGPSLIKNVTIDNFQYGMRVATCEYSMTFENVTLNNQSVAGIRNSCNTLAIRKLQSNNSVPAIDNDNARAIIIDSQLNGGNSSNYAIVNRGFLFARNITTSGYAAAISNNGTAVPGATVAEYHTMPDYSMFQNNGKSLNLPIEETPEYFNNTPSDWANVRAYNARPTNPLYGIFDATAGLQAAFNSGKKVIYLGEIGDNGTRYCIYGDVVIPPTVEKIIGLSSAGFQFFNNSKLVINDAGAKNSLVSTPLFIERLDGISLLNNSSRTVVIKHSGVDYQNTVSNSGGKVFLEDVGNPFRPQFPVNMWARQFNPEVQSETDRDIDNPGGRYWILGLKTEGRANIARTTANGSTEILGGLIYPASTFSGATQQAFTVQDAKMSLIGLTMTSYVNNGWYGIAVQETQSGDVRTLPASNIWTNSPYNFSFYTSQNLAPTAANTTVSGRVTNAHGRGLRNIRVVLQNAATGESRSVSSNSFGQYSFDNVTVGVTYTLSVSSKKYSFTNSVRVISVLDEITDANFIGEDSN